MSQTQAVIIPETDIPPDIALQPVETNNTTNEIQAKAKRVDIPKALTLRLQKNLTYREIADIQGVAVSSVYAALKKFNTLIESPDQINAFERNRSKLLAGAELMLITDMTNKQKREKASINNLAYAFDKIGQAKRLHDGKSTENVQVLQQVITENRDILDSSASAMTERLRGQSFEDEDDD